MKKEYKICIFAILVVLILVLNHVFGWSKYL
ncbi:MAG: TVP38/TMEM64 family protein, partial [Lachnospiraceae bacterium]